MQSLLKQQLRQLSSKSATATTTNPRADKRSKQTAPRVDKQGVELKCGCSPRNVLPTLLPHPRSPL